MYIVAVINISKITLWFGRKEKFDIADFYDLLQPGRTVSNKPQYKSGLYRSEKCSRDIQYESGLELEFIKDLESSDEVLFYWEQPISIPYWRGKVKARTYPDFGIYLKSRHFVIAEVKPLADMLDHRVQAKAEGIMEFCSKRGFGFLLTDGRHTPTHLLKGRVNRKLEKELLSAIEKGVIRKKEYREIVERCSAKPSELYRAIIRHDLKFKPHPFKLQRGNQSPIFRQVYFGKRKYDDLYDEKFPTFSGFTRKP